MRGQVPRTLLAVALAGVMAVAPACEGGEEEEREDDISEQPAPGR